MLRDGLYALFIVAGMAAGYLSSGLTATIIIGLVAIGINIVCLIIVWRGWLHLRPALLVSMNTLFLTGMVYCELDDHFWIRWCLLLPIVWAGLHAPPRDAALIVIIAVLGFDVAWATWAAGNDSDPIVGSARAEIAATVVVLVAAGLIAYRAAHYREREQTRLRAQLTRTATEELAATHSNRSGAELMATAAVQVGRASVAYVTYFDAKTDQIVTIGRAGNSFGDVEAMLTQPQSPVRRALSTHRTVTASGRYQPDGSGPIAPKWRGPQVTIVPIGLPDGWIALVSVWRRSAARHAEQRAQHAEIIAETIGALSEQRTTLQNLHVQSTTDPLTGLANRRGMTAYTRQAIDTARSNGLPISIAVIDIDNLKTVNDIHGHAAGDKVLKMFVEHTGSFIRPGDTLARWGGDEFLMLLHNLVDRDAERWMDHIHQSSPVSFSHGVAQLGPDETLNQAIHRADAAMYEIKRRNSVAKGAIPPAPPQPEKAVDEPFIVPQPARFGDASEIGLPPTGTMNG